MSTPNNSGGKSPIITFILAALCLILTIYLGITKGFGFDSALFAVATVLLIIGGVLGMNRPRS